MIFMMACAVLLGMKSYIDEKKEKKNGENGTMLPSHLAPSLPSYLPVLFAFLGPIFFTTRGILIRRLSDPSYGICFNISHVSMTVYFVVNGFVLIFALIYWLRFEFNQKLFFLGIGGSLVDSVALQCLSLSMEQGPMGPAAAIASFSSVILVIIEALKTWLMPSTIEIIAMILGLIGCLELIIPDQIKKIVCFFRK